LKTNVREVARGIVLPPPKLHPTKTCHHHVYQLKRGL